MPGFEDELPDIQGNILRPYSHPHARYAIALNDDDSVVDQSARRVSEMAEANRRRLRRREPGGDDEELNAATQGSDHSHLFTQSGM